MQRQLGIKSRLDCVHLNHCESQHPAQYSPICQLSWRTALFTAVLGTLMCHSTAFPVLSEGLRDRKLSLDASRRVNDIIKQLEPLTKTSEEKRKEAMKALDRQEIETALSGVDASMLELLSDEYLYPPQQQVSRPRPKGRPDYVPGAMKYDTMVKFRERQDVLEYVSEQVSDAEMDAIAPYISRESSNESPARSKPIKGSSQHRDEADEELPTATAPNRRKRVVKNLPTPKNKDDQEQKAREKQEMIAKASKNPNHMDIQKYYRTALLTADEEYSLGMKIQFMIKCELVHEGLATKLMRLPTIEEWAEACGFTEDDPTFIATESDEQLRPAGSENMFEETDPTLFIGNGMIGEAGPGRGRGREKKAPPVTLGDFHDDSEVRMRGEEDLKNKDLGPINRGTATDFVEMLMEAREAKQRMVQSNMRLVVSIARKYSNVGVSLQDLVQEGSLGLSRAAEKFEPKRGFKFSTYASWWIQQAVFRSIAYHSRTIRLPVHVHNLLNRVRKVRNRLQKDLGRPPTNEEMAKSLGMSLRKYNKMLRLTRRSISLETPKYQSNPKDLGHESDDLLRDTIDSNSVLRDESTPECRVDRNLFHEDLREMLKILNDDERLVISARYGLSDGLTRTVTAVAAQMKQSKAWVRSQECRALRKLRRPWYEKKLKEHQDALSNYGQ